MGLADEEHAGRESPVRAPSLQPIEEVTVAIHKTSLTLVANPAELPEQTPDPATGPFNAAGVEGVNPVPEITPRLTGPLWEVAVAETSLNIASGQEAGALQEAGGEQAPKQGQVREGKVVLAFGLHGNDPEDAISCKNVPRSLVSSEDTRAAGGEEGAEMSIHPPSKPAARAETATDGLGEGGRENPAMPSGVSRGSDAAHDRGLKKGDSSDGHEDELVKEIQAISVEALGKTAVRLFHA